MSSACAAGCSECIVADDDDESTCVLCGCCCRCAARVCEACARARLSLRRQAPDARDRRLDFGDPVTDRTEAAPDRAGAPQCALLPVQPALNQAGLSTCSVQALAASLGCQTQIPWSSMFLYYTARKYIARKDPAEDSGCSLRDACKALAMFGTCRERTWPYVRSRVADRPSEAAFAEARGTKGAQYYVVDQTLPGLLECLSRGLPVALGMSVYTNIQDARESGVLGLPGARDLYLGGHAVLLCGYDLASRTFTLLNCWGPRWGAQGLFTVPFAYALNPELCWDLWVVIAAPKPKPKLGEGLGQESRAPRTAKISRADP